MGERWDADRQRRKREARPLQGRLPRPARARHNLAETSRIFQCRWGTACSNVTQVGERLPPLRERRETRNVL